MENKPRFSFGFINVEELENKEIVIWGTEAAARLLVYALDVPYKLAYYCDNRQNTWGGGY